jgi:polysaccharide export outer membrane protein
MIVLGFQRLIRRPLAARQLRTSIACVALLAACTPPPPQGPVTQPAQASASEMYVIGPGDSLRIFVYQAPDLSGGVAVRPDGRISVPLVGDITAAGKQPMELAKELEVILKKYVHQPTVTVIVNSFVGPLDRQVRIIGEATDPSAMPYRDGMTLLDVMIATKGLTKFAAGNRAVIIRRAADGTSQSIPVRLSDLIKDGDIRANMPIQPGDTLIIPQTWF